MELPKIIKAKKRHQEALKAALILGFSADPLVRWFFPDPTAYLQSFNLWIEEFSKISFSHDIAFAEEKFLGASLWLPPGVEVDESVFEPTWASIPEDRIEILFQILEQFAEFHADDCWYLAFLAVDPSMQGQGIGSFILKEALQMIDAKGERAYLEASSERNRALYERHGFEMIGKVQIQDSPPAFPMIREAQI